MRSYYQQATALSRETFYNNPQDLSLCLCAAPLLHQVFYFHLALKYQMHNPGVILQIDLQKVTITKKKIEMDFYNSFPYQFTLFYRSFWSEVWFFKLDFFFSFIYFEFGTCSPEWACTLLYLLQIYNLLFRQLEQQLVGKHASTLLLCPFTCCLLSQLLDPVRNVPLNNYLISFLSTQKHSQG